jgi:hypothetical protein
MNDDDVYEYMIVGTGLVLLLAVATSVGGPIRRKRQRRVDQTRHDHEQRTIIDTFQNTYQRVNVLPLDQFNSLLELLRADLQVDAAKAELRTGKKVLSAPERLQIALRYLGGARVVDLMSHFGVSERFVWGCIYRVCELLMSHPMLTIKFPKSQEEQEQTAADFTSRSYNGVMNGCVGAIDGWLCLIRAPSAKECSGGNVIAYFSGHYMAYGVNVQACVDVHSRFTAVSINCPGKTNDAQAWTRWSLSKVIERLPFGKYLVGDNAYPCHDRLLTPFNATEIKGDTYRDAFNFYLSQLRIRVEMAFGLLVTKFRIFKKPLEVRIKNVHKIVHAAMVVHNYHVTENLKSKGIVSEKAPSIDQYFGGVDGPRRYVIDCMGEDGNPVFKKVNGKYVSEPIPEDARGETVFRPNGRNHNDVVIRPGAWHAWGHADYDRLTVAEAVQMGLERSYCVIRHNVVEHLRNHAIVRP